MREIQGRYEYSEFVGLLIEKMKDKLADSGITVKYESRFADDGILTLEGEPLGVKHPFMVGRLYQNIKEDPYFSLDEFCEASVKNMKISQGISEKGILEKEDFYDRSGKSLFVTPLEYRPDSERLKDRIFEQVQDIALEVLMDLEVYEDNHVTSIIPEEITETCDKTKEEIVKEALLNTSRLFPLQVLCSEAPYLIAKGVELSLNNKELCKKMMSSEDGLVLTADGCNNGAIAVFYPGVLEQLAQIGRDGVLYITFPNIRQVIIHDNLHHAKEMDVDVFNLFTNGLFHCERPSSKLFCFDRSRYEAALRENGSVMQAYQTLFHLGG